MTKNFQTKNAFRDAVLKYGPPIYFDGQDVIFQDKALITPLTVKGRAWHNGYSWCYYFREKYVFAKHGLAQDQINKAPEFLSEPVFEHYTLVIAAIKHQTEILEILLRKSVVILNNNPDKLGMFNFIDAAKTNLETFNSLIKP